MIKVIELFGGIGAATQALKRSFKKENIKILDYVELDKHAVNSYNAINGTNFKPTDINDIDMKAYPEVDIVIAGWPCQDYSIAGKGLGLEGTRSNLILLTISKIKEMTNKPKHILLENVKGLLSKKHAQDLEWIKALFDELGYNWDQAMLNSKYFDVPQARERVFMLLTRKDLKIKKINHLENRKTTTKTLNDILDYSLETFNVKINKNKGKVYFINEASQYKGKYIQLDLDKLNNQDKSEINKIAFLGTIENTNIDNQDTIFNKKSIYEQNGRFNGINGLSATLRAASDNTQQQKIIFKEVSFNQDKSFAGGGGIAPTLVTSSPRFKGKIIYKKGDPDNLVIHYRKLSTLECWRLMGFSDENHNNIQKLTYFTKNGKEKRLISDSQLSKQAGNSIVVNVLEAIFKEVFNG